MLRKLKSSMWQANEAIQKNNDSENTYVHVWNLTSKGVGHTAIQVGEGENQAYTSIHPDFIPACGPLAVVPLPANIATTLDEDMAIEGMSRHDGGDLDAPFGISNTEPTPAKPERTIKIAGLDTKAMRKEIQAVNERVAEGDTYYQLIPKVNTHAFFKDLPTLISQDPVDATLAQKQDQLHTSSPTYNCATLVSHILKTGGAAPMKSSSVPWHPTPNDVMYYAEELSSDLPENK